MNDNNDSLSFYLKYYAQVFIQISFLLTSRRELLPQFPPQGE